MTAKELKFVREKAGIDQAELAGRLDVSLFTVSRFFYLTKIQLNRR